MNLPVNFLKDILPELIKMSNLKAISIKNMFDELRQQGLNSDIIDETYINNHLMTKDYPDPELLIRTSENKE